MTDTTTDIENFVRDVCQVIPRPKSEVRRRLTLLLLEAREDEVKTIWGHAREHTITDIEMIAHHTDGKVDFIEAVDTKHLEARLSNLKAQRAKLMKGENDE